MLLAVKLNNPQMGTETSVEKLQEQIAEWKAVKLNNPQMGTETCNQLYGRIQWIHNQQLN